jgi:hypothetical protein
MKHKSARASDKKSDAAIQVLKEDTCPASSGKSTLGYQVGIDDTGAIQLRVSSNDGGGFFSNEWISYADIQVAINDWPEDQGISSMAFRKAYIGLSSNSPGFLVAILCALELLEPMPGKSRVHQACDPSTFLASVEQLRKEAGGTSGKRPAAKAKAKPKAKAKAAPKAKARTPRKTAAASRKRK